jgi:diguanylate cyclase (GGDEF)-like protein/PAS domain S-box-containing protein
MFGVISAPHSIHASLFPLAIAVAGILCVWKMRTWEQLRLSRVDPIHEAFNTFPEGILVLNDHEHTVLVNQAFCKMVSMTESALLSKSASKLPWLKSKESKACDFPWIRAIREQVPQNEQLLRFRMPSGEILVFSVGCSPLELSAVSSGAIVTFRDVTELEGHRAELHQTLALVTNHRDEINSINRELKILATRDELTGCLNRRALIDEFAQLWQHATANQCELACLMVDNDHFKQINDVHGHLAGDTVLKQVADVLMTVAPVGAVVCRYGGEEFCVVLPGSNTAHARQVAEQMRLEVATLRIEHCPDLSPTVSIGVSELAFGAANPCELINEADQCLYRAKKHGRNRVVAYGDSPASYQELMCIETEQ